MGRGHELKWSSNARLPFPNLLLARGSPAQGYGFLMKALKLVALTVLAVVVPGLLAVSIYLISAHSFEAPASAVPRVRGNIASPNPQWSPAPRKSSKPKSEGTGKDVSGPCDEAEHADEARCAAGGVDDGSVSGPDDSSGSGSDNSGSDNSGSGSDSDSSGSDNSGSDEDSSGSGSDGSDELGSSGGDD